MPTLLENSTNENDIVVDDSTTSEDKTGLIFNISPWDGARCKIVVETGCDIQTINFPVGEEFEVIIGEAQTEIEEKIETALCGCHKGQTKEFIIDESHKIIDVTDNYHQEDSSDIGQKLATETTDTAEGSPKEDIERATNKNLKVTLIDFQNPPNVCDYTLKQKLDIAKYHKSKGIELFQSDKTKFAYKHFSKALKFLILMLPKKDVPSELKEEYDVMRSQCYSNMAACLLKENQYKLAIKNCTKSLEIDQKYVKSIYRRAEAYFQLGRYAQCKQDVEMGLRLEPNNKVFLRLSKRL